MRAILFRGIGAYSFITVFIWSIRMIIRISFLNPYCDFGHTASHEQYFTPTFIYYMLLFLAGLLYSLVFFGEKSNIKAYEIFYKDTFVNDVNFNNDEGIYIYLY